MQYIFKFLIRSVRIFHSKLLLSESIREKVMLNWLLLSNWSWTAKTVPLPIRNLLEERSNLSQYGNRLVALISIGIWDIFRLQVLLLRLSSWHALIVFVAIKCRSLVKKWLAYPLVTKKAIQEEGHSSEFVLAGHKFRLVQKGFKKRWIFFLKLLQSIIINN